MKGIRIHSIVRELNNENIDLIEWSDDDAEFIKRSLSPAKIKEVQIDKDSRSASIVVPDDQVSFAIGKNGQNVRLASKITGYNLTLIKEGGEDIDIEEFKVEFGEDIYDEIVDLEIATAREFLEKSPEELLRIKGMTKELLIELRQIILIEFDEKESQDMIDRIKNVEIEAKFSDEPDEPKEEANTEKSEDEEVEEKEEVESESAPETAEEDTKETDSSEEEKEAEASEEVEEEKKVEKTSESKEEDEVK